MKNAQAPLPGSVLLRALCFVCLFCLLAQTVFAALPQTPLRYQKTKEALEILKKTPAQAKFRTSWEKLYGEFMAIYTQDTTWANRPCALFRAAECIEGLAKVSFQQGDAKRAVKLYESVAANHPRSPLADDALYRAAKMHTALLRDDAKALDLLAKIAKSYAKSDMATDAQALEQTLRTQKFRKKEPESPQAKQKETPSPVSEEALAKDYQSNRKRMRQLASDSNKTCWRKTWEQLETDFLAIHKQTKDKTLGAKALYLAGEVRLHLAQCSNVAQDYRGAQELYQSIPLYEATSSLADDALMKAAQIAGERNSDVRTARRLLTDLLRHYPKGDQAAQARSMLAKLTKKASAKGVALELLTWDSIDKNRVQITLELSGKTTYSARMVAEAKGRQKHLFVDLNDTEIAQAIRKGVVIKGSLLEGVFVEQAKNGDQLLRFDLREARRFDVSRKPDTPHLLITVDARKSVAPKNQQSGQNYADASDAPKKPKSFSGDADDMSKKLAEPANLGLAQQLGLSVSTVFIDAGHGGKDPGTYHNNIVEKFVAMDVARTLGRLLENTGLRVLYSRNSDKFIKLTQRTAMANAAGADLFVSIHVNANPNPAANGFETYFLSLAKTREAARLAAMENIGSDRRLKDMQRVIASIMLTAKIDESKILASDVQRVTLSRLKRNGVPAKNNGTKSAPFHVLVGAQMPAVLVELGYCSNPNEAKKLASARYREILAEGLAEGIMAYKGRLTRKHTVFNAHKKSGAM
ncbi:MAG: N-acetylmuramoyl-L-alanine amidase [Desulfovibrio sp.]|nr:N-acetylmuramoyl-L-alanine amidase [Desulfovibrio sp.]